MITLDLSKAKLAEDLGSYKEKVAEIHDMIRNKTGAGNDFLGWVELPENYDKAEVELIKKTAANLKEKTDVSDIDNIKLGSKVHHPKFGTGTVVALKGPDVTIAFDNQGIKTINKEYTTIDLIKE